MVVYVTLANPYVLVVYLDRKFSAPMQKYTATGHDVRTILGRGYVLFSVGDTWCEEEVCTVVIFSILCIMEIENVCTSSS